MCAERVYEAAARLGVTSRRLLVYLGSQALPHGSASSTLSPGAVQLLSTVSLADVLHESAKHLPKPDRWVPYWHWEDDDLYWRDRSYFWSSWAGPAELTTAEAAAAYRVAPATIRQWVSRGHLKPLRKEGHTVVFAARDVNRAALSIGERNKQPGGSLVRDGLERAPAGLGISARLMAQLVTTEVAARAAKVSPSTIRSWRRRGHLRPADHRGRTPLYLLIDVVVAARRDAYRPPRKSRPLI